MKFETETEAIASLSSENESRRVAAAIELGYLASQPARAALLQALAAETEARAFTAICAGLELLDDPTVCPDLFDRLELVAEGLVYELCQVLSRYHGFTPYLPLEATAADRRAAWLSVRDEARPPCRIEVVPDGAYARMRVFGGMGRLRLDFEAPTRGTTNWPRFFLALHVGREAAYRAGTWCPTCELWLSLLGWPELQAAEANAAMSESVQAEVEPTAELLNTWKPLLGELVSGEYLTAAFDFHVERITEAKDSYFTTRSANRETDDSWDDGVGPVMPGTPYFQGPRFDTDDPPTYWVVMPSQPLEELDEAKVCEYETRIRRGEFPTVVVLGWVDIRHVEAEFPERFIVLYVLDGHHKLEAYARARRSAHFVGVFMPDYPALQRTHEVLDQLANWGM